MLGSNLVKIKVYSDKMESCAVKEIWRLVGQEMRAIWGGMSLPCILCLWELYSPLFRFFWLKPEPKRADRGNDFYNAIFLGVALAEETRAFFTAPHSLTACSSTA